MAAISSKTGAMKRRQSGRRRGARVLSDMRRPLGNDFVNKAMRGDNNQVNAFSYHVKFC
jgi:hypothetical protein